jgi:4-aminobutyrate aminotransferase-like enzyme
MKPSQPREAQAAAALLARDARFVTRPWSGMNEPVVVVEARDCVVTDAAGKQFVDYTSGYFVNQAGHCNPRIVQAATAQMAQVTQMSHRHATVPMIELAEMLATRAPVRGQAKVFFTTGGSESTEFALKMARQYTKKRDIAYLENAFHGLSLGALALCGAQKYRDSAGVPLGEHTFPVKNAYSYRCTCGTDCSTTCLDQVERALDARPDTAALIAEPVQSVGGLRPTRRWWDRLDAIRKQRGLLLILDEIQTGLGRTGTMFAAEHYGLEPDIMTLGKGLSGGIGSLGAVVASEEVQRDFFGGTTPTSAANAVSAAAGVELIKLIEDEDLAGNAARMGERLTQKVAELDDPWIGDIRWTGLIGGVELVSDRATKAILGKDEMNRVKDAIHQQGFLITLGGTHGNCLRLQPPLTIQPDQVDGLAAAIGRALVSVRAAGKA